MIECTVDTHILAELLMQYSAAQPNKLFEQTELLTSNITETINICVESNGYNGVVVASSFAFVEILNQFTIVSKGQFELSKVIGILEQPPGWFIVEPYTSQTVHNLIFIPKYNLDGESVELADAIHVATAIQRGPNTLLATHDGILSRINYNNHGIALLI
jgi:predicted nucleic acid-binding protein